MGWLVTSRLGPDGLDMAATVRFGAASHGTDGKRMAVKAMSGRARLRRVSCGMDWIGSAVMVRGVLRPVRSGKVWRGQLRHGKVPSGRLDKFRRVPVRCR